MLVENYRFADWFSHKDEVEVAAAAFGQTPVSYDTACIGVVCSNGLRGQQLINRCRALGAPVVLEIGESEIFEWLLSPRDSKHDLLDQHPNDRIDELFAKRASAWKPESMLRDKNIGSFKWERQLDLFAGLVPELEEHIRKSIDPLLKSALSATSNAYLDSTGRKPEPTKLFKLVFWLLTAKVFADRREPRFASLSGLPNADDALRIVARHYKTELPRLLNRAAREEAARHIWTEMDFRNLSVEVLAQTWATTLVDDQTRKKLGIHRTSRTIVKYIVDRIVALCDFTQVDDDRRIIFEPFSGSAVFLVGAMNALRNQLFLMDAKERHKYFTKHLSGLETEPFGVEISKLALSLADFPNHDGWNIAQGDVFSPSTLTPYLQKSAVVLCNPPFEDFDTRDRKTYQPKSPKKPAEFLHRLLVDLHPRGVLGLVLPRSFADGSGYKNARIRLAERFANIELTVLPDRAFESDAEVCLLVATDPIPHHECRVRSRRVDDNDESWRSFALMHEVSVDHVAGMRPSEAEEALSIPDLPELWRFLVDFPVLADVAELHRGLEWRLPLTKKGQESGHREHLVKTRSRSGYMEGVPPNAKFRAFERPPTKYLNVRPDDQRGGAYKRAWSTPKVIVNKTAKSRGKWRLAAYPDSDGLTCYQTFTAIWPTNPKFDELLLAAIINSPVANAYVSTREGKVDITIESFKRIPVPHFTGDQARQIRDLVRQYQGVISSAFPDESEAERLVLEIDATVLDGYYIPPKLQQELLEYFGSDARPVLHRFMGYPGVDEDVFFTLSDRLDSSYKSGTVDDLLDRLKNER